jgi:NAD(P)-dependent dehydrogenase (short-subunit alcohol dehydrogenase family)
MTRIRLTSDEAAPLPELTASEPGLATETDPRLLEATAGREAASGLRGKVALVSGGDHGFGRTAAIELARAGAEVAILYLDGHEDAQETMREIVELGRETMALTGDIGLSSFCDDAVTEVMKRFARIDILVNATFVRDGRAHLENLEDSRIERTFRTNIIGQMFLTRAALPHLRRGASIINTGIDSASGQDWIGIDAAATSGAIAAFTRALATTLAARGIRANVVAPREDCPAEATGATYVFLAGDGARLMTGQTLRPDGGSCHGASSLEID